MKSRNTLVVAFGALLLTSLGTIGAAHAQYYPAPHPYGPPPGYGPRGYYGPPRGVYREGLVLGVALGAGAITANDCPNCGGGALGLEGHIGGMVNPRLAILAEAWGLVRDANGGTLSNSVFTGALQFWVADQFWLKGGLGAGTIQLSDSYSGATFSSESAFAITGAAGFEIVQWFNFALDLQFRLAHMAYSGGGANNIAFMVGFNWY